MFFFILPLDIFRCLPGQWYRWYRCIHHHRVAEAQQHHGASSQEAPHCPWPSASCCERWVSCKDPASTNTPRHFHWSLCVMQHGFITVLFLSPGQEGDTCLRSADCSEGLCCARHFWSRICKPVLTEGQVCTRHRRKGTHGLELFQRCDCGDGLACRPEKGERDHSVSRTAARNLHTCQRRWHKRRHTHRKIHIHTHKTHTPSKATHQWDTEKHFSTLHTPEMLTHRHRHLTPKTFFPAKAADSNTAPGRIDMTPGKVIHPEGCNSARRTDPIPHQQMRNRKLGSDISEVFGTSIHVVGNGRTVLFLFLWNFEPQLLQ